MRIVFFGTPAPATEILQALVDSKHQVVCVVTQPDRKQGRGQKTGYSPIKELGLKLGLPLEQPEAIRQNSTFEALLRSLQPDLAVVAAYGKIFPPEILAIPKHGFINLHLSLLPKYRGAAPVQWALLNGETETGVTVFKLVEALDAGPILLQEKISIREEETAESLLKKLFRNGSAMIMKTLELIEAGKAKFIPQNEAEVSYAPAISKESAEIDWKKSAEEINNRIRALQPWPAAHTFYHGKRLKILKARVQSLDLVSLPKLPGTILHILKSDGLLVAAGEGDILVSELQLESGKRMKSQAFALGHGIKAGEIFPS